MRYGALCVFWYGCPNVTVNMNTVRGVKMGKANEVAKMLSERFMKEGSYALADVRSQAIGTQPIKTEESEAEVYSQIGASGLSVHSVGCTDDTIYIYTTKSPGKASKHIPQELSGVNVVVKKIGKILVEPEATSSLMSRGNIYVRQNGAISCGSSCAPAREAYSGTFGALVRLKEDNSLCILSNNHVLSDCNHVPAKMPILSPSNQDTHPGGVNIRTIAHHKQFMELRSGDRYLVPVSQADVAIAEVTDVSAVSSWQGDLNTGYDTPTRIIEPKEKMRVKKFGRTTGLTKGIIEAFINTPFPVPYKGRHFTARVWMQEIWTIQAEDTFEDGFSLPGDSGSLVVTEDGSAAVGLLFAAKDNYALMIPMTHISNLFGGLSLVGAHRL